VRNASGNQGRLPSKASMNLLEISAGIDYTCRTGLRFASRLRRALSEVPGE